MIAATKDSWACLISILIAVRMLLVNLKMNYRATKALMSVPCECMDTNSWLECPQREGQSPIPKRWILKDN